eukprot:357745-Chlamydomonas_euryale.AAC.3
MNRAINESFGADGERGGGRDLTGPWCITMLGTSRRPKWGSSHLVIAPTIMVAPAEPLRVKCGLQAASCLRRSKRSHAPCHVPCSTLCVL